MGRTGLHLYSWVLQAVTSCRVTQSPDSTFVSIISPRGHGANRDTVNEVVCYYCSVVFRFFIFFFSIIIYFQTVAQNVGCFLVSSNFLSRLLSHFHAELHLQSSQTNEFSMSILPHLFSVSRLMYTKVSLNTSIMKSTQRLSMAL